MPARARGATLAYDVPRLRLDAATRAEVDALLRRRAPLILVDDDARARVPRWTTETLARAASRDAVPLERTGANERACVLTEYLKFEDEETRGMYMRNLHLSRYFPKLAEEIRLPEDLFGENALADETKPPNAPAVWRKWFELFVCHAKHCAGFPFLHRDSCCVHAASYQILGRKRFTLFAPSEGPRLYQSGGTGNRSMIEDIDAPDVFERYPEFRRARRLTVDVSEGEILVVPSMWWHTASPLPCEASDDVCVSVAASFVDDSVYENFLDAHAEFQAMQSLVAAGAAKML